MSGNRTCWSRRIDANLITVKTMTVVSNTIAVMKLMYWCRNEGTKVQPVKGGMAGPKVAVTRPYGIVVIKVEMLITHNMVTKVATLRECFHIARTRNVIATTRNINER
jgi:hypothetical protein